MRGSWRGDGGLYVYILPATPCSMTTDHVWEVAAPSACSLCPPTRVTPLAPQLHPLLLLIEEADGDPAGLGLDRASSLWVQGACGGHTCRESLLSPNSDFQSQAPLSRPLGPFQTRLRRPHMLPCPRLSGAEKGPQTWSDRGGNRDTGESWPRPQSSLEALRV